MEINLEIDSTANPFLKIFPKAVEFKIRHLLSIGVTENQITENVESRKHWLEDSEVEKFLYPTGKALKDADVIFQRIAEITALLAFSPGGITMFGWRFEVDENIFRIGEVTRYQGYGAESATEWTLQERR